MPTTPQTIVIATGNPHKVRELRAMLALPGLRFVGLGDLPEPPGGFFEPDEVGTTFEQNAAIKALSYAQQTGLPCLADDSGLEVDALGGSPGVISSHYCTNGKEVGMSRDQRDMANNELLLKKLANVPAAQRSARFVCVMKLATPTTAPTAAHTNNAPARDRKTSDDTPYIVTSVKGLYEGRIGIPPAVPAGTHGFGYDPLFLVRPDFACTSAELLPEEKNAHSHRALAAVRMLDELRTFFQLA